MLETFLGALHYFTEPGFLLWFFSGVVVGLIFGIVPGVSGLTGITLFLPFAILLPPEQSLTFMIAVMATCYTAGSMTAVILGIPGTPSNIAACLDGYPMTQRGEGGRSMAIALISDCIGGSVSGLVALAMIPVVAMAVNALGSPELVFIILLGILCIGELSAGALVKGLLSGILGLTISLIGNVPMTGQSRFTFGSIYLYGGLPLVPIALGLFAMPILVDLIIQGGSIARAQNVPVWKNVVQAFRDIWHSKISFIRGTIIGYVVGLIPAIGGTTATWVSYGQAKSTSKNAANFGKGEPEGLVAATCSVTACGAGDLLTTLALGIPGSASMAIVLGVMLMGGIVPGPQVVVEHLTLSLGLIYVVVAANLVGALICMVFTRQMVSICNIPGRILIAIVIPLVFIGVWAGGAGEMLDLITLLVFTIIGIAMAEFGYSRPALFLGYILGTVFENYLSLSYQGLGPFFFMRPISLALLVGILAMVFYHPVKTLIVQLGQKKDMQKGQM